MDGNRGGNYSAGDPISHTCNNPIAWWEVDLGEPLNIFEVVLYNRADGWQYRLNNVSVLLKNGDESIVATIQHDVATEGVIDPSWSAVFNYMVAQKVRVQITGSTTNYLHLAEVEVLGFSSCTETTVESGTTTMASTVSPPPSPSPTATP